MGCGSTPFVCGFIVDCEPVQAFDDLELCMIELKYASSMCFVTLRYVFRLLSNLFIFPGFFHMLVGMCM